MNTTPVRRTLLSLLSASIGLPLLAFSAGPELPPGFLIEPIGSDWHLPTGIAFLDANRLLVSEKAGLVWYVENDVKRNVVLDIHLEALNNGDRGLLSIAADPAFDANGWIYLLLVVDPNLDGQAAEQEAFSRLVRYGTYFDGSGLHADPSTRFELLGASWPTGIPSCHLSHATGALRFLADGSLLVSHGDGAHYDLTDSGGHDADCFTSGRFPADQDIGSFRSLYANSLCGKILRLDPATGAGLADNPFYDGDPNSIPSRTYALGLRNPHRFNVVPSQVQGEREVLLIGDVGWNTWEEVNVAHGGENFGWPCYEGPFPEPNYQANDPHGFCPQMAGAHVPPMIAWHHFDPSYAGYTGNCATGVIQYQGSNYPPIYRGAVFFMDYGRSWLQVAYVDESWNLQSVVPFGRFLGAPVDLVAEPGSGDLIYTSLGATDAIYRIRYTGSNLPPQAIASADPAWGDAPLQVQLRGSDSFDPEQESITYHWDLGDGTSTSEADPLHLYPDPAIDYRPRLTVRDPLGFESSVELLVTPGNTPPSIDRWKAPRDGDTYVNGQPVELRCSLSDLEDDATGGGARAIWHVDLRHDHHIHPDFHLLEGEQTAFVPDEPYDGTWLRLRLEARDSRGLAVVQTIELYDSETVPKAHIADVSDVDPRLGQTVTLTGHMEFPGNLTQGAVPRLTWDWGDGSQDVIEGLAHQKDSVVQHLYTHSGTYDVRLIAALGEHSDEEHLEIRVLPKRPAVAIFVPFIAQKQLSWEEQQSIATAIEGVSLGAGAEARTFYYHEQEELVAWMQGYLSDDVDDILLLLDLSPALVYAGEDDGSLAETWIEAGNTILWTGYSPFSDYIYENGTTGSGGAGFTALDEVLDATGQWVAFGSGWQIIQPPAYALPSLHPYQATRALKYDALGPQWHVDIKLTSDPDFDSDQIVMRRTAGGRYGQFYTTIQTGLPRTDVLREFFLAYVLNPSRRELR